ncbi:ankyrin repeat domain-containing protein, partial [Brachyspira pilosicoli]|uniref:ankyrin repeat domain-containing protein n=2 Tax=Brachyspira TaxID=29521 RepID=UPI001C6741D2
AASYNQFEAAKILLENNADISITDEDGDTALMHAANNGNTNIINMLLENGADINYTNDYGMTALMYAANSMYAASYNQF